VETLEQSQLEDIERCIEEMTETKMERLAEKRVMFDSLMKNLRPEKHAERIEKLRLKKEEQLVKVQTEIRTE